MKLISLNIEGDKHWDRIIPFLISEDPDMLCVQEIFESDMERIPREIGMRHSRFVPMALNPLNGPEGEMDANGLAIFTKADASFDASYYKLPPSPLPAADHSSYAARAATHGYAILTATLSHEGKKYVIGTTHLCVTYHGLPDEFQTADAEALLALARTLPPHVLCGDFNMPRSINLLHKRFTEVYTDAIPASIEGSLDPELHRAFADPVEAERVKSYMVDYLFTMPGYTTTDVHMYPGVSDHKAIIANLEKTV